MGVIDDHAVESISLIVELTKSIKTKMDKTLKDDDLEIKQLFPRLLWLLRDFTLDLNLDGRKISEDDYLENALKPLPVRNSPTCPLFAGALQLM
jgi:hypothetical protein